MSHASESTSVPERPDATSAVVRYLVTDVDRAVRFYTERLGFTLELQAGAAFAAVSRGHLRLLLSGPGSSGARAMPDGRAQVAGGWNRIVLYVDDLGANIERLRAEGIPFRNDVERGPGGAQIQLEDPDGNPIELHEAPAGAATSGGRLVAAAAALLGGVALAAPAAAQATLDVAPGVVTAGRARALVAGVVALIGLVLGGLALARSARRAGAGSVSGQGGAIVAAAVALIGVVLGALHVATSTGGLGTGSGRGGAVVAMVMGLIGMALGALAVARSRREG
jgi:catechol 2,3-dioxygenase-like lactoylglutathione lyase family enzyme